MTTEKDGIDAFVFVDGVELVDFKCCRGDREDITEAEVREQLHAAFIQKKLGRATVSPQAPSMGVPAVDVRRFILELAIPA